MQRIFPTLLLFLSTAAAQEPGNAGADPAVLGELASLERVWNEAHTRGDADALDRLWDEDLVVMVPNMKVMTKQETIGIWRSGHMKFQRYETSNLRIKAYGNAAVVTGRVRRSRAMGERTLDDDWWFTKVYVRRAEAWKVVAWHASAAPP